MSQPEASPGPQLLPHSRENEESLLGAILINPNALLEVLPLLQVDDFYIHRHRWVWEAFLRLNEGSRPIDLLTVANELQAHSKLEDVGGMAYLTGLINIVPPSFHAVQYARTVADLGLRRRVLNGCQRHRQTRLQDRCAIFGHGCARIARNAAAQYR